MTAQPIYATTAARRNRAEPADATPFISIVMPCLNEEESIAGCVFEARSWLRRAGYAGEVVVVDNGSHDGSAELAAAAGARVIAEARRGYGAALRRGFLEAQGDWIVMGDCDSTYDWSDLEPLVAPLRDEDCDLVVGDRFSGGIAPRAMTWSHRYVGTPALSLLLRLFAGLRVGDSQCGLRAFKRETLDALDLRTDGMELASEMILKAARNGLRVASVAVPYKERLGEAKLNTFRDGWRHLRFLLLASPNHLFTLPGLLLSVLGLLTLALALPARGIELGDLSWQPVFAGCIFLVVGVNALLLGFASRLYTTRRGLTPEGAMLRFYHRYLGWEAFIALGLALGLAGCVLDAALALQGAEGLSRLALAGVAQAMIITAADLGFTGAMCGLLEEH